MHTTRKPLYPTSALRLLLLLSVISATAACGGPEAGSLAPIPLGITYHSGDMNDTIDGQMGLTAQATTATVNGGLGFEGPATVSCGPQGDGFLFRLRPEGRQDTVLTLSLPGEGHGGHGGHGEQGNRQGETHGDSHADPGHGPDGVGDGTTARLLRFQNGELIELTGSAEVSKHASAHVAGRHAVSGDFTATIEGTELSGDFAHCFYFPG